MTDYIRDSKEIASQLESQGFSTESQRILEAISAGSTGTEIAMAVRWVVREELGKLTGVSSTTRKRMESLAEYLSTVLDR